MKKILLSVSMVACAMLAYADEVEDIITVNEALTLIADGYTDVAVVKGVVTEIQEINTYYGNATYTIKDSASDENGLVVFRGKYLEGEYFTSTDQLSLDDEVVVKGYLLLYDETPEMGTGSILLSINGETTGSEPETPEEGIIFSEPFSSSLGVFTIFNYVLPEELEYVWTYAFNYGAKASAYNEGSYEAKSYLISPVIDLSDYQDVVLNFDHAINYINDNNVRNFCQLLITEYAENPSDRLWKNYSQEAQYPMGDSWAFANSDDISLSEFEGKKIQIAFYYKSTDEVAPTWEIKNFVVKVISDDAGVEGLEIDSNTQDIYYNLQGVRVNNPSNGLYIHNGKKVMIRK